jgi:hypothetical protein
MDVGDRLRGNAAEYRQHAVDCIEKANAVADPDARSALLVMARGWVRLAELATKNSETDLTYETPTPTRDGASDPGSY